MSHPPQSRANPAALLKSLEEQLLQPATRRSPEAVAAMLADDFREFGASGRIYTKSEVLAQLAAEPPSAFTLTDFGCQFLSPAMAHVTYCSARVAAYDASAPVCALRSSLWVLREGRWQMLFHQGTRI